MRWYTIPWFGGIKVECEKCHNYTIDNEEQEAHARLYACETDALHIPGIIEFPSTVSCTTCKVERELVDNQKEIKKLKESIYEWKYGTGGWFELRDIIGNLWWNHPSIKDDSQREYYQSVQKNFTAAKRLKND
jgi:hypothetical protein